MSIIVTLLILILVVLIILYIRLGKSLANITVQLKQINSIDTNSKILLSSQDKKIRKLTVEINKTLVEKRNTEAKYKKMDMELRQAIANISHDLRTPLTSIIGYIQLMEEEDIPAEERKKYSNIVKSRADALQRLITSFYDLSRLEAKEYKFDLKAINLTNIMYDITASFYNDFVSKGIEPVINMGETDKALIVIGDENAVRRVISNLVQNMIKYGEKNVYISSRQENRCIISEFRNSTTMLKEEDVKHLFERFFTGDRARSDNSTGLGLAITKQLLDQMGHSISAEIVEGELKIIIKWKIV